MKFEREVREFLREGKEGLRRESIMPSWLFHIFFDRVVTQGNERTTGRGTKLKDKNGREGEKKPGFICRP